MTKMNRALVLDYLRSIAPRGATNSEIRLATGSRSHQQVFVSTRDLMEEGLIRGEQVGREWIFYAGEDGSRQPVAQEEAPPAAPRPDPQLDIPLPSRETSDMSPGGFEALARQVLGAHFGTILEARQVDGVPKRFDLVSRDGTIVGDAKYFTLVGGQRLPPAKFSVIAEHVWLLEHTRARTRFLVFGNEREVPLRWLARYGSLVVGVTFYFLTDQGELEQLYP
jgi:hypothetical protein